MNICDNCGKETRELYPHRARIPENPDELVKGHSKIRIKTIEMQICSKCLNEYETHQRAMEVKGHRIMYEEKGDIEDLK